MQTPIYITPIDPTPTERSRIIRMLYPGVSYTPEQVEALDEVVQLHHRLASTYGGPQPMTELSPAGELALGHGWLVRTSVGYEPTLEGLLIAGDLREQAGYSRIYEPWDEVMAQEKASPSNFVQPESIPDYYVLDCLQGWERLGVANKTVIQDGYTYPLLAKPDHFELYPSVRFPQELVANLLQRDLVTERSGGLYLTDNGETFISEIGDAIAEELREAEDRHDANLALEARHRKESNVAHATVCATGPAHEPEDKNGTKDGFTSCLGCGNDLWAGYIEDEQPNPANK